MATQDKSYRCASCNAEFNSQDELDRHTRSAHKGATTESRDRETQGQGSERQGQGSERQGQGSGSERERGDRERESNMPR